MKSYFRIVKYVFEWFDDNVFWKRGGGREGVLVLKFKSSASLYLLPLSLRCAGRAVYGALGQHQRLQIDESCRTLCPFPPPVLLSFCPYVPLPAWCLSHFQIGEPAHIVDRLDTQQPHTYIMLSARMLCKCLATAAADLISVLNKFHPPPPSPQSLCVPCRTFAFL